MTALRVGVQLYRNAGFLQAHVVTQRILDLIHMIVLVLQEERRRCLRRDVAFDDRIERRAVLGQR